MNSPELVDEFRLGEHSLTSRVILGTGKYENLEIMQSCHRAARVEMVTVALRRIPLNKQKFYQKFKSIIDFIDTETITLLPNTAGAHSAAEALKLALIAHSVKNESTKKTSKKCQKSSSGDEADAKSLRSMRPAR